MEDKVPSERAEHHDVDVVQRIIEVSRIARNLQQTKPERKETEFVEPKPLVWPSATSKYAW